MIELNWLQWRSRAAAVAGLLLLSSCGGGGGGGSMPSEPGGATVTIQVVDFAFNPKDVRINPGDTVQWVLASSTYTHTVTANDGSFDSGMAFPRSGATFSHTFNNGGTFAYHCATHWHTNMMQGAIIVGDGPAPPPTY
jgi:plastocyanin